MLLALMLCTPFTMVAQELQVKVSINTQQVGTSDKSVFDNLQQTLEQWMNDRQWTDLQFQQNERIVVNFNLTVTKYDKGNNRISCTAMIQANRPVYNSSYTTTLYNNRDADFNFDFAEFDQLNYNDETIDNQLTALMAYYAYLIIGLDLDSFSPLGGTDVLQRCMQLTNNAQDLGFTGFQTAVYDHRLRGGFELAAGYAVYLEIGLGGVWRGVRDRVGAGDKFHQRKYLHFIEPRKSGSGSENIVFSDQPRIVGAVGQIGRADGFQKRVASVFETVRQFVDQHVWRCRFGGLGNWG